MKALLIRAALWLLDAGQQLATRGGYVFRGDRAANWFNLACFWIDERLYDLEERLLRAISDDPPPDPEL